MVGQRKRRVNSTCEETVPGRFGYGGDFIRSKYERGPRNATHIPESRTKKRDPET